MRPATASVTLTLTLDEAAEIREALSYRAEFLERKASRAYSQLRGQGYSLLHGACLSALARLPEPDAAAKVLA